MIQRLSPSATHSTGDHLHENNPACPGQRKGNFVGISRSLCGAFLVLVIAMGVLAVPAAAYPTPYSMSADSNVYVSNITYDPAVFFTGDSGTVTYTVTNGNTNTSMVVNHAAFSDNDMDLTSGMYDATFNIGPLQTQEYTFSITTNATDGIYYPTFSITFQDGQGMHYQGMVKVDNRPLVMTILSRPDAFTQGKKDTICVQIANPRDNDVHNVILDVTGNNVTLSPSKIYIGDLPGQSSTSINFTAMPAEETTLSLAVGYDNGDNYHSVNLTLPVQFGVDKTQANPVMSNVVITLTKGVYQVTGDITNAGLLTANGVTVTSLSPASPQDPDGTYVIGTLKQDDFGTYEVTFSVPQGTTSVPLQISYKDKDGNVIASVQPVSLVGILDTSDPNQQPSVIPGIVIVLVIIGGAGWYLYRKKQKKQ